MTNNTDTALETIRMAMAKLMSRQFFYFNIASQFRLKEVPADQCPTMGVAHIDGLHWMVYNPEFIKYYNYKEISVILEHEICHFTFDHVKHFSSQDSARKIFKDEEEAADSVRDEAEQKHIHRIQNIATDRSINVYLFDLPNIRMTLEEFSKDTPPEKVDEAFKKGQVWFKDKALTGPKDIVECNCITEDSFKNILKEAGWKGNLNDVKKYADWKYYFDLLMSAPKTKEAIQNIKDMDVHFGDDGQDERGAEQGRDRIMIEAARKSNRHDIPGDLRDQIAKLFDKYKDKPLPWNVILRRAVAAAKRSIIEPNVNTRNRYYGNNHQIIPGYKSKPIKEVAIIWDVSGSCIDEETQSTFIQECNGMIKSGCEVRVYYTDQDVEHVQDCKEKVMAPSEYQITGGGGTHLDNGIKRAIDDGYKIIIQLSDNYMDFRLTSRDLKGRKIINVCTTDAKQPTHYGPTIHVNV